MMQTSVGPGIAPRSCNFQSAKISSSHGVPMISRAKYSIRCDAAPNSTEKKTNGRHQFRQFVRRFFDTNLETSNSWSNGWWIWRRAFSWIFLSPSLVRACKWCCIRETYRRVWPLESIDRSRFCDEIQAIRRTIAMQAAVEHSDELQTTITEIVFAVCHLEYEKRYM